MAFGILIAVEAIFYVEDRKAWKDFVHCFRNWTKNQPQITKNVAETTYFGSVCVYD